MLWKAKNIHFKVTLFLLLLVGKTLEDVAEEAFKLEFWIKKAQ